MPLRQLTATPAGPVCDCQPEHDEAPTKLRARAEGLLRDLAFVLRATQTVREAMTEAGAR